MSLVQPCRSCLWAPLLLAIIAVACERSPVPSPAPPPSEAPVAVHSSPPASASSAPAPPRCADWTVADYDAQGSLEHWCRLWGPCPENLQQGVARVPGLFPTIEVRGHHRILHAGFLGGFRYTFESDRLVGAEIWDDMAFGPCAERGVGMYRAGLALPHSPPGPACGVVPGRDYTNGEPCRCNLDVRRPTLQNGNQGPTLRTSLECLYEAGVAGHLCQPTLRKQQELVAALEKDAKGHAEIAAEWRRARGNAPPSAAEKQSLEQSRFRSSERAECGGTVITWPYEKAIATCRYDATGALTDLRWGKRYESEGFATCQR